MNITHYWTNKLLDFQFRTATLAKPTAWYYALFTVLGTDAGTGFTEPVGGAYARQNLAPLDTNYLGTHGSTAGNSSGTTKQISNAVLIAYPTPTLAWGDIIGFGLYDALTAGNLCYYDTLDAPLPIGAGDTPIYFDVNAYRLLVG